MDICGRVWVGVAYYINLVFVRFLGLDVSELSLTTDHLIHICFHSCTYSDKRDVLFLLVRRMLSSLADFVAGGPELLQFSGWFSNRDPERRGSTNHTQRCGLLQEWRTFGGPDCEASGQYCQHVIHDLSKELAFSQTLFEILQFSFFSFSLTVTARVFRAGRGESREHLLLSEALCWPPTQ